MSITGLHRTEVKMTLFPIINLGIPSNAESNALANVT